MSPLSPVELAICAVPAIIVIVIVVIVVGALRRKPPATPDNHPQPSSPTIGDTDLVSSINSATTTATESQNGLATTSLIISVLALAIHFISGPTWSNVLGFLAMILGAIALLQIRKRGGKGKGIALAAIALGTLPFIITLATLLLIAAGVISR